METLIKFEPLQNYSNNDLNPTFENIFHLKLITSAVRLNNKNFDYFNSSLAEHSNDFRNFIFNSSAKIKNDIKNSKEKYISLKRNFYKTEETYIDTIDKENFLKLFEESKDSSNLFNKNPLKRRVIDLYSDVKVKDTYFSSIKKENENEALKENYNTIPEQYSREEEKVSIDNKDLRDLKDKDNKDKSISISRSKISKANMFSYVQVTPCFNKIQCNSFEFTFVKKSLLIIGKSDNLKNDKESKSETTNLKMNDISFDVKNTNNQSDQANQLIRKKQDINNVGNISKSSEESLQRQLNSLISSISDDRKSPKEEAQNPQEITMSDIANTSVYCGSFIGKKDESFKLNPDKTCSTIVNTLTNLTRNTHNTIQTYNTNQNNLTKTTYYEPVKNSLNLAYLNKINKSKENKKSNFSATFEIIKDKINKKDFEVESIKSKFGSGSSEINSNLTPQIEEFESSLNNILKDPIQISPQVDKNEEEGYPMTDDTGYNSKEEADAECMDANDFEVTMFLEDVKLGKVDKRKAHPALKKIFVPEWAKNIKEINNLVTNQINSNLIDKVFTREKIENFDMSIVFSNIKLPPRGDSVDWRGDLTLEKKIKKTLFN